MVRWFPLLVVLLVPICVGAILGDLNKDGKVDFSDFFLFADQFGKEGPPEPPDTVVVVRVDTLRRTVRDTVVVTRRDTLRQTVRDTIRVYQTVTLRDTIIDVRMVRDTVAIVRQDTVRIYQTQVIRDTVYIPSASLDSALNTGVHTEPQVGWPIGSGRIDIERSWRFVSREGSEPSIRIEGSYKVKWTNTTTKQVRATYHLEFRDKDQFTLEKYTGLQSTSGLPLQVVVLPGQSREVSDTFWFYVDELSAANSIVEMQVLASFSEVQ